MEQAVQHHLSRIDEWERPEFNRTLAEALCSLKVQELNEVFEMAWRLHRTRNKALENPAGWWASTLKRTAEACRKAYRQPVQLE